MEWRCTSQRPLLLNLLRVIKCPARRRGILTSMRFLYFLPLFILIPVNADAQLKFDNKLLNLSGVGISSYRGGHGLHFA